MDSQDEINDEEIIIDDPGQPAGSTAFDFEHKIFQLPDAHFAHGDDGATACFFVPLGGVIASIPVMRVCFEFKINYGTRDFDLIGIIAKALDYVREIRPGDSIPSELLDGSASWSFKPKHAAAARTLMYRRVAAWLQAQAGDAEAADALRAALEAEKQDLLAATPQAFAKLAASAELGDDAKEAAKRCATLARETTYIEALRDHYGRLFGLPAILDRFRRLAAKDRNRREEYDRMLALTETPVATAREAFKKVDRLMGGVSEAISDLDQTVQKIRMTRDRLHSESMVWSPVAELWHSDDRLEDDKRRVATYRYLASKFAQGGAWTLTFRQR